MTRETYIYFLQARGNGPIKIGTTSGNPLRRMRGLQTGCPWPIELIGAIKGTSAQERKLHQVLSPFRTKGEWFEPHETVLRAIKEALACGQQANVSPTKSGRFNSGNALAKFLNQPGQTATALAAKVGCEVSTITRLAKGERSPSIDLAFRIERATSGIVTIADLALASVNPSEAA